MGRARSHNSAGRRQVLRVGVTGHRVLTDVGRLEDGLDAVVARLDGAYPEEWEVVSALAEGADRLVAHRLLERGRTRLVAVLPVARADYEADFVEESSRRDFRALLDLAAEVVDVEPHATRDDAYAAAGSTVLDRSDVLVAVWDGDGAQGTGGSGGIVTEARRRAMPIAWVHAGNRRPGTREPTSLGAEQGAVTFERFPAARERA